MSVRAYTLAEVEAMRTHGRDSTAKREGIIIRHGAGDWWWAAARIRDREGVMREHWLSSAPQWLATALVAQREMAVRFPNEWRGVQSRAARARVFGATRVDEVRHGVA